MATRNNTNIRTLLLNALRDVFNTAGTSTIEFRTGSQPANSDAAATGTLLATITLPNPAFAAAQSGGAGGQGTVDKTGTWSATVVASGACGYMRIKGSAGSYVLDLAVGLFGSGADCIFDDVDFVLNGTVVIDTCTIKLPHSV